MFPVQVVDAPGGEELFLVSGRCCWDVPSGGKDAIGADPVEVFVPGAVNRREWRI